MKAIPVPIAKRALLEIFPGEDPYSGDPLGWADQRLRGYMWSMQKKILVSVRDHRFTAVPACHGPGKSYAASVAAAWWIDSHPPGEAFVISTAPTDAQVKAVLWREIKRRHRQADMPGRITLEAQWYVGKGGNEELVGIGRKPQDYDPDAFQGIHAKYILIIVDEAGGIPKQLFDALETLMTSEHARMLAIGNPDDPAAYFATICRPGSGWNVMHIPAFITPNFTGEYCPEDIAVQLVTKTWVNERKWKWGVGSPLWQSKVMAQFPEVSDDTLITPKMIRDAQQLELPGLEYGRYGLDVARFGADETVCMRNRGGKVRLVFTKHKSDTIATADHMAMQLRSHGSNVVPAVVDEVGIGAGVVDYLKRKNLNIVPFNGGVPAYDRRRFVNRRAEAYWLLREAMERGGEIDIDPDDEELANQLQSIKWRLNRKAAILLESKDDMRRRGLPSPDRADTLMMCTTGLETTQMRPVPILGGSVAGDLLSKVM